MPDAENRLETVRRIQTDLPALKANGLRNGDWPPSTADGGPQECNQRPQCAYRAHGVAARFGQPRNPVIRRMEYH